MQNIDQILSALKIEKRRRKSADLISDWELIARPEQKIPDGNWFGWFIMAGRGFGKTRTGAETIKKLALSGQYKRICLLAETYDQARSIMIYGESGLMNIHSNEQRPIYKAGRRELVWPNGTIATCFSAENYEALRGPQFDLAWVDELAKFENAKEVWDQLMFCLRLGNEPKVIITSTPRPNSLIMELANRKDIHLTTGSTFDNARNLPPKFLEMIKHEYGSTKLGLQEIEGQLISNDSAALWNRSNFQYATIEAETEKTTIIAIDPAASSNENSNETGIIVASKLDGKYYILEDASAIMSPEVWAEKANELHKKYSANEIVVETNQGGEILMAMLQAHSPDAPWKGVRAKNSKYARAKPIASLYQQKKVYHASKFEALEEQLCKAHVKFADDRLDALVWALFSLIKHNDQSATHSTNFSIWS